MCNMEDIQAMRARISELEAENARLRNENIVLRQNQNRQPLQMSRVELRPPEARPPSPLALPPAAARSPSPVALSPPAARSLPRAASTRPAGQSLTGIAMARARQRHRQPPVDKVRANAEDAVNLFVLRESTTQNDADEWVAAQLNANQDRHPRWLTELISVLDNRLTTRIENSRTEQVLRRLLAACREVQARSPPLRPANAANMLWRKAVRL